VRLCLCSDIVGLGGSSSRCEQVPETVSTTSPRKLPALVTESEHIGDDWLVDDARGQKRKCPNVDRLFRNVDTWSETKRTRAQQPGSARVPKLSRSEPGTSARNAEGRFFAEDVMNAEAALPESTKIVGGEPFSKQQQARQPNKKQARLSSCGTVVPTAVRQMAKTASESSVQSVTSTTVIPEKTSPKPNPLKMRLKVRIGDQLILVPVLERSVSVNCVSLYTIDQFANLCMC